jgi:hypothetical protein
MIMMRRCFPVRDNSRKTKSSQHQVAGTGNHEERYA